MDESRRSPQLPPLAGPALWIHQTEMSVHGIENGRPAREWPTQQIRLLDAAAGCQDHETFADLQTGCSRRETYYVRSAAYHTTRGKYLIMGCFKSSRLNHLPLDATRETRKFHNETFC